MRSKPRLGAQVSFDAPLGALTTYGVGGGAAALVDVEQADQLDALRSALVGQDVQVFVVGRGSNVLVSDAGFDGVAIRLGAGFNWVKLPADDASGPNLVQSGAATPLPVLARQVADAGWSGLSWAVGVPGSVGGAVRMNAGGHGSDMAACVVRYSWVDVLSEAGGTDGLERLHYGYRSSSVRPSEVVVSAELGVVAGEPDVEQTEVSSIVKWRREHQPGGANAGSVFANPEGDSAGRLIEACGLKGFRLGTAHVSEKHANFIQADKGGRADDVRDVMEHVRAAVHERVGVVLRTEVRLLGFPDRETGDMSAAGESR